MKAILVLLLLVAPTSAQDTKPEKAASAPTTRPYDARVLNRKVSLSLPGDWVETEDKSTFALDWWEHGKSWKHPGIKGFTVHLYGATSKDLTPASLIQKWLEGAGSAKIDLMVTASGKSRQMSGQDIEAEIDENGSVSYYWLRAIGGAKDRVMIVLAEASPLDYETFETVSLAAGPILDSFLDPAKKDPWKREATVSVKSGSLTARLTPPAGWKYGRGALSGSLFWSGPEKGQEITFSLPQQSTIRVRGPGAKEIPPQQIFNLILQITEAMAKQTGKLLNKTAVPGHDAGQEFVTVQKTKDGAVWNRDRLFLDGSAIIRIEGHLPVKDVDSLPTDAAQKQITAVFDSLKIEIKAP